MRSRSRTPALGLSLGLAAACGALAGGTADSERAPAELGQVRWGRALEPALELSARTERPVLLLFQEVPG